MTNGPNNVSNINGQQKAIMDERVNVVRGEDEAHIIRKSINT